MTNFTRCLRKGCYTVAVREGRCPNHAFEVERRRKFTPIEQLPHEDPLLTKIMPVLKAKVAEEKAAQERVLTQADVAESFGMEYRPQVSGGFTPATGPGKVAPASFEREVPGTADLDAFFTRVRSFLVANSAHQRSEADRYQRMEPASVMAGVCNGKAEAFDVATRQLNLLRTQSVVRNAGISPGDRNLVENMARDLFQKGSFGTELLLRGLLSRSDRLGEKEDLVQRLQDRISELERKKAEVQGRLDFTYQRMETKTQRNGELERRSDLLTRALAAERLRTSKLVPPTWKSSDGVHRTADRFVDGHLLNTIRFIERIPEQDPEELICDYDGDAGPVMDEGKPAGPQRYAIYPLLLAEARKRKLLLTKDTLEVTEKQP